MPSELVFGFDIGTTSIGSAVVRMDSETATGELVHMGVRVFPEARDPRHVPLNEERRRRRMNRRQLRRRRHRRQALNRLLHEAELLPPFSKAGVSLWTEVMMLDPWELRSRAVKEALSPHELGRALYQLAKRRHFRGRDLEDGNLAASHAMDADGAEEQRANSLRARDRSALEHSGLTLGAFLSQIPERSERRRGRHFAREDVLAEFSAIIATQAEHHAILRDANFVTALEQTIFDQRPVFWRKATLGACRFIPGAELAAWGSWIAQERRMLEKINNLRIEGAYPRALDDFERAAVFDLLRKQDSASWNGIRRHLKLYWRKHDLPEKPAFNLERGGEKGLGANRLENRLATILGERWETDSPLRERLRREIHQRIYDADYGQIGARIVIRGEAERCLERARVRDCLKADFALTDEQVDGLAALTFPPGWEPFSQAALWKFLPRLQEGAGFGALLAGPEEEEWREETFPDRERPSENRVDRLPTPRNSREEVERQKRVRNPTVLRVQNELRKVVNNLIAAFGRPDRIRVAVARDVGRSARQRAEDLNRNRARETVRKEAVSDLRAKGISEPSRDQIEKWLLWKECRHVCPYSGEEIGFSDLFGAAPRFEVAHIWPRWLSLDDSFANKTLCRRDVNAAKSNRAPLDFYSGDPDSLEQVVSRVRTFDVRYGPGWRKVRRFLEPVPHGFVARQLADTGHAALQAVRFLQMLFPDLEQSSDDRVAAVSGRVVSRLRHHWGLYNILSASGETTRADHRHHAIDALVVALADAGYTQRLSGWFRARDTAPPAAQPPLDPPIPDVRGQCARKIEAVVVSHRVRRKVSGALHKDTTYGDAGPAEGGGGPAYRWFVTRKPVEALTKALLADDAAWSDARVRQRVRAWVEAHGGDPKKAFANGYPTVSDGGAPIRSVRIRSKQQVQLMAKLKNGYADLGNNHHVAVFRRPDGQIATEIVSLFEAADRLRRRQPVFSRTAGGACFVMTLAQGDTLQFPEGKLAGLWVVQGLWSVGQVVLWRAEDATGVSVFRPTVKTILKSGARKVSVDPIGRIRRARD